MLPRGSRMGAAWQVRKWLACMKCSSACTSTAVSSTSAVPMPLVPLVHSAQLTPGASATLPAFSRKSSSPMEWRMVPCASVSTTMLWVFTIWSNSSSITGAAWANRRRLRSRVMVKSARPSGV